MEIANAFTLGVLGSGSGLRLRDLARFPSEE